MILTPRALPRLGWCGVVLVALALAPGLAVAFPLRDRWRRQALGAGGRAGWVVGGVLVWLYLAPTVSYVWPGNVLMGTPLTTLLPALVCEALLAPLALSAVQLGVSSAPLVPRLGHWIVSSPPARSMALAAPVPAVAPLPTVPVPVTAVRLGHDTQGRSVALDLAGEASVLVVGLPGTGKTVTLVRLIAESLRRGWCVVILDLKGSGSMRAAMPRLAAAHGVPLHVFDPGNPASLGYNPCLGSPDAVASKLVGAFTYTGVADVYSQVGLVITGRIVTALQAVGTPVTLDGVIEGFEKTGLDELREAYRTIERERHAAGLPPGDATSAVDRLARELESAKQARVLQEGHVGIQKRLTALADGAFAPLLRHDQTIDLAAVTTTPSLTYFALSALARPTDVAMLGKVLIQELKMVADGRIRQDHPVPCLVVIDEFPALGEPLQLVDLILQGREAGMTAVASGQFLPQTPALLHALLGAGVVLAHRVAGPDADLLATQFGTRATMDNSITVDLETGAATRGSFRSKRTFTITPDQLRELGVGEAALRVVRFAPADRHRLVTVTREDLTP